MILRAAYATRSRGGLGRAKAGARYVIHRPSDTASREYRTGFDADDDRMEKDEICDRPESAEGTYFYRLTLAPGEGRVGQPSTPRGYPITATESELKTFRDQVTNRRGQARPNAKQASSDRPELLDES